MQIHDLIFKDGSRMMRGLVGDVMTSGTSWTTRFQDASLQPFLFPPCKYPEWQPVQLQVVLVQVVYMQSTDHSLIQGSTPEKWVEGSCLALKRSGKEGVKIFETGPIIHDILFAA